MLIQLILLMLLAGVPYYLLLEKIPSFKAERIFLFSVFLMIIGLCVASSLSVEVSSEFILVSLLSAVLSLYKATKTTNFYRLSYYVLFVNAPVLILFNLEQSVFYALSLIVTLFGLYFMGKYYEEHYGSANYHAVTGITLVTPYAGLFLTLYLITLALYPPFPNSLLFLYTIIEAEVDVMWYITVVLIFFGNFILAMRVMAKTVFGKANPNIHYIDLNPKEKAIHVVIILLLLLLSLWGLKEVLV